jgi:hypothetical protein
LFTTIWGSLSDPEDDRDGLSGLDGTSNVTGGSDSGGWVEPDYPSGEATLETSGTDVEYTTLNELVNGTGISGFNGWGSPDGILAGGTDNTVEVGADPGSSDLLTDPDDDDEGELVFYILFELPTESGNVTQGDELSLDLRFSAEQVRNNDDPRSGRRN